jgi:hypothetical protein
VVEGVLEAGEEAGVFGEVVGAYAEEFAEFGEDRAVVILDDSAVAGGTGVAAGSAVAVGVDPGSLFGGGFVDVVIGCGRGFGKEAGDGRGTASHRKSLRES